MSTRAYVAIDLGAESGRVIVGTLTHQARTSDPPPQLHLHEVHRFIHAPLQDCAGTRWDIPHIWSQICIGLRAAADLSRSHQLHIVSVGVDCWGVDYVLLDAANNLLALPRCYRDPRHAPGHAWIRDTFGFDHLFELTGIQELPINTLPQLAASIQAGDPELTRADRLLLLPDYFHLLLGAPVISECTIASTSQLLSASTGSWAESIIERLGLRPQLFPRLAPPGTRLAALSPAVAQATGLAPTVSITLPASHDTASAVVGIPAQSDSWAYISSGTWSLVGIERTAPILAPAARLAGFSNERGAFNTFRFQKNVIGLWLLQELRRDLERRGTRLDYAQLATAAAQAPPFRTRIDPAHPDLIAPGDAIEKLKVRARAARDPEPRTPGEFARTCLEALAIAYRRSVDDLERLTGAPVAKLHIVGGGVNNLLLNQFAANATGKPTLAGPVEATAAGNVLMQASADGQGADLHALRTILASSTSPATYAPADTQAWSQAYSRHRAIWNS